MRLLSLTLMRALAAAVPAHHHCRSLLPSCKLRRDHQHQLHKTRWRPLTCALPQQQQAPASSSATTTGRAESMHHRIALGGHRGSCAQLLCFCLSSSHRYIQCYWEQKLTAAILHIINSVDFSVNTVKGKPVRAPHASPRRPRL